MFVASGSRDWNEPSIYPDTFGFQTSYVAEGKILPARIKSHFAGQTVGFVGQKNDRKISGCGTSLDIGLPTDGGVSIAPANDLSYNAADAISGSSSDIQQDVATLQAGQVRRAVVLDSVPGFTRTAS